MNRRLLLRHGLALTPLAAGLLAACGDDGAWPEGMLPIKWDRDTCARCGMAISDRRFAAQVRGGPKNEAFKFDDIGCAMSFCAEKHKLHPWLSEPATRYWVASGVTQGTAAPPSERTLWLDARSAHFIAGPRSPMGYSLLAVAAPQPGSLDFTAMGQKVVQTWPADCQPGATTARAAAAATLEGGAPASAP